MVGPRANGGQDLVRFGRRKDELHVFRGFFDDLQQGVETLLGDHVGFIEDEDLESISRRGEHGPLAQLPRIIDTVVARGVDFDDVQRPPAVSCELDTTGAHATGGVGRTLVTVQTASENPR